MNAVAVAVPNIPREDWTTHPRFRTQALLLGSHANFRRVSRYLVDQAAREEFVGLHSLFDRWIAAMRSHEAYEERKLYPYLEYRWRVSLNDARPSRQKVALWALAPSSTAGCKTKRVTQCVAAALRRIRARARAPAWSDARPRRRALR